VAKEIAAAHAEAEAGAGAGAGAVEAAAADGDKAGGDAGDGDDAVHATAMLVCSVMVYRGAKDAFDAATKGHTKPSERAAELLRICKDRADEGENVTDAFQRLIGGEDGLHRIVCDAYKVDPAGAVGRAGWRRRQLGGRRSGLPAASGFQLQLQLMGCIQARTGPRIRVDGN
jgi:hypothetical protein